MEKTRSPRFLGNPCLRAPLSDPGGISPSGLSRRFDVAFRVLNHVGSRDNRFRGSITQPTGSLSTLNPSDHSKEPKTRFRMAASLVRAGLLTRRVPMHIFRVAKLPFPRAQAWPGALNSLLSNRFVHAP